MAADPVHRHGGPDAGWYVPVGHGWQRISDHEVRDHGDAAHFMSDPNGRHPVTIEYVSDGIVAAQHTYTPGCDGLHKPGPCPPSNAPTVITFTPAS